MVATGTIIASVTEVVDGDTIKVGLDGDSVRIIGIDAPESGACGADEATQKMQDLVLFEQVTLTAAPDNDDRDKDGRLLRYVNTGSVNAGWEMIDAGWRSPGTTQGTATARIRGKRATQNGTPSRRTSPVSPHRHTSKPPPHRLRSRPPP